MKKCDFCDQSSPSGGCPWRLQAVREPHCKKAIKNMVKAFGKERKQDENRR